MNEKIEVLVMQESERKRIADELHDTTVQDLVHLSQQLELATMYMNSDLNQTRLELVSAKKLIKKIIQDMRGTIYDLRPMALDDIGWNAALDKLKKDFKEMLHYFSFCIRLCTVCKVAARGMDAFAVKLISAKLPRRYCTKPSEAIIAALSVQ